MTAPAGSTPPLLATSVATLASHIFDEADLIATSLTPSIQSRCFAVIVLAHAEIEEAIEEACRSAVRSIEIHARPDFHFLAWGLATADPRALSDGEIKRQMKARSIISYLATEYLEVISHSNGIKRRNLGLLLLPLGVDLNSLQADIDNLNSFGERRGDAAHLSPLKARIVEMPSAVTTRVVNAAISADAIIAAVGAAAQAVAAGRVPMLRRPTIVQQLKRLMRRQ